jgi:hypothetical protein
MLTLSILVIGIQVKVIIAPAWSAAQAVGVMGRLCLEAEAVFTGKPGPAASAHAGKVPEQSILLP